MNVESRDTWIEMFGETIRHTFAEIPGYVRAAVYGKRIRIAVWPEIVNAAYMVIMGVRDQKGPQWRCAGTQYLRAKIRSAVNE